MPRTRNARSIKHVLTWECECGGENTSEIASQEEQPLTCSKCEEKTYVNVPYQKAEERNLVWHLVKQLDELDPPKE